MYVALLCFGVLTPLSCIASGVAQIAVLFGPDRDLIRFALSISITAVPFLVGPGGYSGDPHLFGRRLIRSDSK
jgi:hypothetical protein